MAPHVDYLSFPWEGFSLAFHVLEVSQGGPGHPRGEQRAPPAGQESEEGTGKEN